MMKTQIELYENRHKDIYPSEEMKEQMLCTFFPENYSSLIDDLSHVTSAFYGLFLEKSIKHYGPESADKLSRELFYDLGKLKTRQAKQKMKDIPYDTRAIVYVLISAIFNASPEYIFEIKKFSTGHSILLLKGVDRYFRISTALNIASLLRWPVLTPFIYGVIDELHLQCDVHTDLRHMDANGETLCIYEFINHN